MKPPYDESDEAEITAADRGARGALLCAPPFSGPGVRWPGSEAEAHFLHRRKILTVNGTHTTLAFLTLSLHEPPPKAGLPTGDYELLRAVPFEHDDDDDE